MASIQGIYLALFGRPADPDGLAYWNAQSKNGADLAKIIDVMTKAPEAVARFSGLSDAALVTGIYTALFDRAPDAAGLAFFTEQLKSGKQTIGSLAINILDGASGNDLVLSQNREKAANAFTASLDTPAEIAAYRGTAAADFGRSFVKTVTADPASVPTPEKIQASINTSLPGASSGQTPAGGNAPADGGGTGGNTGGNTDPGTTNPQQPATTYKLNASVSPKDGSGNIFVGSGNSADKFAITTHTATGIELGLSVRHRLGEVENGTAASNNAVQFKNVGTADLSVAYSVYKNGGVDTANHTYKLFFDNNPSTATPTKDDGLTFILEADATTASKYKWTLDTNKDGIISASDKVGPNGQPNPTSGQFVSIIDDAKDPAGNALQNIQPLRAYIDAAKGTNTTGTTLDKKGTYDVTLSSSTKAGALEAQSTVQIVVNNDVRSIADAKTFGFNGTDFLFAGKGNSTAHFANVTVNPDGPDPQINLGISGRQSLVADPKVGLVSSKDGLVHFTATADATNERFGWSVSTQTNKLDEYKFLLKIDTDSGLSTKYVEYQLVSEQSSSSNKNNSDSKVSWTKVSNGTGFTKITDDGGDSGGSITQNIQNLSWFDSSPLDGKLAVGRYDVVLEAWSKDGTALLGMNHVVFDAVV